jgi:HEAT repeat protein
MEPVIYVLMVLIAGAGGAGFWLYRRSITLQSNGEKIKEHKEAMLERISNEADVAKYTPLDYSLFKEHKDALIARISDEDWFEKFISLLFVRNKKTSVAQAFLQKASKQSYELKDIVDLSRLQPILIIGDAGSGKTTSLRKIAVDLCNDPEEIPLLLNLALYQTGDNLLDMLNTERKLDKDLVYQVFSVGKATVLVDQLNEIKEGQEQALDALNKLMTQFKGNRYIIAVRTSGYLRVRNKTEAFVAIEVEPLTLTKINAFLEGYLGIETANTLLSKMDNRIRGLCANPLMLSMVASVYEATKNLPSNRSELYDQFLYQLLHNWDQKTRHSILAAYIDDALSHVSYGLNPTITAHPMTSIQSLVSECVPSLNQKYIQNYTTQMVSDTLQVIAVTRVDRSTYKLFFIHQSIQEFYAAKYIISKIKAGELSLSDLEDKFESTDWIEPIFFVCGLLEDATELISMLLRMKKYYVAAQCVQNAKKVEPTLVDDLIVYTLTAFKYTDDGIGEQEVVAYDLIRALWLISDKKSNAISKRLIDDMNFFIEKYSTVGEYYTIIPPDEMSNAELIKLIETKDNPALEPDYLRSLGVRKAKEAAPLVMNLALDSKYPHRDEAIWTLGEIGNKTHTEILINFVDGTQPPQVIVAACNALIRAFLRQENEGEEETINSERAVDKLIEYINNLSYPNREAAGWALSQIAGASVKDVYIQHMTTGNNYHQRAMFVWLTGLLGIRDAISKLTDLYPVEPEAHVREDIVFALGDLAVQEKLETLSPKPIDQPNIIQPPQTATSDAEVVGTHTTPAPNTDIQSSSVVQPEAETVVSDTSEMSKEDSERNDKIPSEATDVRENPIQSPQTATSDAEVVGTHTTPAPNTDIQSNSVVQPEAGTVVSDTSEMSKEDSERNDKIPSEATDVKEEQAKSPSAILTPLDKIIATLKLALKDEAAVVRMQAINALEKSGDVSLLSEIDNLQNDNATFVKLAAANFLEVVQKETKVNLLQPIDVSDIVKSRIISFSEETRKMLIEFLIEIGRWAKNELSERWKVKRKEQEIDLSNQQQVRSEAPKLLDEIALDRSEKEIQDIIALIQRKRETILTTENAKLAEIQQLQAQEISRAAYEIRLKQYNETIRTMMTGIQSDLEKLGMTVDRDSNS